MPSSDYILSIALCVLNAQSLRCYTLCVCVCVCVCVYIYIGCSVAFEM